MSCRVSRLLHGAPDFVCDEVLQIFIADWVCRNSLFTGRVGNVLLSGDDVELCYVATSLGLGVATFPEMKVLHLIPKERLSVSYLVKIIQGHRISNILLEYKWLGIRPRSPLSARSLLFLAEQVLTTDGIRRRMHIANWRAGMTAKKLLRNRNLVDQI